MGWWWWWNIRSLLLLRRWWWWHIGSFWSSSWSWSGSVEFQGCRRRHAVQVGTGCSCRDFERSTGNGVRLSGAGTRRRRRGRSRQGIQIRARGYYHRRCDGRRHSLGCGDGFFLGNRRSDRLWCWWCRRRTAGSCCRKGSRIGLGLEPRALFRQQPHGGTNFLEGQQPSLLVLDKGVGQFVHGLHHGLFITTRGGGVLVLFVLDWFRHRNGLLWWLLWLLLLLLLLLWRSFFLRGRCGRKRKGGRRGGRSPLRFRGLGRLVASQRAQIVRHHDHLEGTCRHCQCGEHEAVQMDSHCLFVVVIIIVPLQSILCS